MRLDKFLKVSTLIRRRTIAKEAAENNIIYINDKLSKPSTSLKVGDIIKMEFARKTIIVKVTSLTQIKGESMFDLISEERRHN